MTRKEIAAEIRATLSAKGIKANVRMTPGGWPSVQVNTPKFNVDFSDAERAEILAAMRAHGLTGSRGMDLSVYAYGAEGWLAR